MISIILHQKTCFLFLLNWQINKSNIIHPSHTYLPTYLQYARYNRKKEPKTYISGIHVDHPPSKHFQTRIPNRRHRSPDHRDQIETEVSAALSLLSTEYVPRCCKIHVLKKKKTWKIPQRVGHCQNPYPVPPLVQRNQGRRTGSYGVDRRSTGGSIRRCTEGVWDWGWWLIDADNKSKVMNLLITGWILLIYWRIHL